MPTPHPLHRAKVRVLLMVGIVAAVVVQAGPLQAADAAPAVPPVAATARPTRLVCIGDSLTNGDGVPREQTFPALIGTQCGFPVVSQGRSGWSTVQYLKSLPQIVGAVPADADAILIQLGANDLRKEGHTDATVAACAQNLEKIIDAMLVRVPRASVTILGSPPLFPERYSPRIAAAFNAESSAWLVKVRAGYAELAKRRSWRFIDTATVLVAENTLDGAHPDPAGHLRLAAAIRAATGW